MKFKSFFSKIYIAPEVYALSLGSFFNDMASEMIIPLIPIFLTTTLGTPIAIVGIIVGISDALANVLKVFSGWISDKLNVRKPIVVTGYTCSAIAKALIGFAYNWPTVLAARAFDRIGKGIRTSPRDAIIADASPKRHIGQAFGFHRVFDSSGAIVGPLVAILLLYLCNNNFRAVFLLTIIPSIISLFILISYVEEKKKKQDQVVLESIGLIKGNTAFNKFLFISAIFAIGNSSEAFLILRAQSLGFPISFIVFAHVLSNVFYSMFAFPLGLLADYINPKKIIIAGYFVFAGTYALAGLAIHAWWIWLILPLYGIFMAMTESINKIYITHMVNPAKLGTAFGLHQTLVGIGTLLASTIAGLLWTTLGKQSPFYFGSTLAIIAAIIFWGFRD